MGLQGRNCGGANVTLGPGKISAQAKHFAVYGAGGRDGYTPMGGGPSERTVFEIYLRPWLKFAQAGGRGVMLSHNMALWEPMHASFRLVTETLRNRFGLLGGYTGSDMGKNALSHKFQIQSNVDGSSGRCELERSRPFRSSMLSAALPSAVVLGLTSLRFDAFQFLVVCA
jgi:beta-glucosidase-like glycosyl hydrolase